MLSLVLYWPSLSISDINALPLPDNPIFVSVEAGNSNLISSRTDALIDDLYAFSITGSFKSFILSYEYISPPISK